MTTSLKTITSSTLRDNLSDALDEIVGKTGQVLLIQRHGETDAALINIDLLEAVLDGLDKKLLVELNLARRQVKQGKTAGFTEVFGEL
jgi:PHD/YefM family antitoxin component YafN of YafNO toxin-antitoxin module